MSTVVRDASLRADRSAIIELLVESLDGWTDDSKFDWLYLDSPLGEARCWVLVDDSDDICGVSAAFPRELRCEGRTLRAWVLGDFCVARQLRSLGPAIKLQRAAFRAVDNGDVDLFYDFPSQSMMAVYRRMGARHTGEMVSMVHLLKTDRAIAQRVGHPGVARALSAAGNALLASRAALVNRDVSATLAPSDDDFVATPKESFVSSAGIVVNKTASYLNWRYRRDPRGRATVAQRSSGEGFIVYQTRGEDVHIIDIFGVQETEGVRELVLAVVEDARAAGATSVRASLSEQHPWLDTFGELGFSDRGSAPFVVYAREGVVRDEAPWFLMDGDRDL